MLFFRCSGASGAYGSAGSSRGADARSGFANSTPERDSALPASATRILPQARLAKPIS
jgi:hypothetical protein